MGVFLSEKTLGTLGTVRNLPCVSDCDPGADDDNAEAKMDADTDIAVEIIGRACRAVLMNPMAAVDLLRNAADLLLSIADETEAGL